MLWTSEEPVGGGGIDRHAESIEVEGVTYGHVSGRGATVVAAVVERVVAAEIAMREISSETLELYRQMNVLHRLAANLAGTLDPVGLAERIVEEIAVAIPSDGIALLDGDRAVLAEVGTTTDWPAVADRDEVIDLVDAVIVDSAVGSLLVSPLVVADEVRGHLVARRGADFRAAEAGLASAIAAIAGPALAQAWLHREAALEAARREDELRRQLESLRIELDEATQTAKVSEVTGSAYFAKLRDQAGSLRTIIDRE